MTHCGEPSPKCFKRKYILFGEKILRHKFEIHRIWQTKKGSNDFCFIAKCKRCDLTQTWWDMPMDALISDWKIDEFVLFDLVEKYPNEYFHNPNLNTSHP